MTPGSRTCDIKLPNLARRLGGNAIGFNDVIRFDGDIIRLDDVIRLNNAIRLDNTIRLNNAIRLSDVIDLTAM